MCGVLTFLPFPFDVPEFVICPRFLRKFAIVCAATRSTPLGTSFGAVGAPSPSAAAASRTRFRSVCRCCRARISHTTACIRAASISCAVTLFSPSAALPQSTPLPAFLPLSPTRLHRLLPQSVSAPLLLLLPLLPDSPPLLAGSRPFCGVVVASSPCAATPSRPRRTHLRTRAAPSAPGSAAVPASALSPTAPTASSLPPPSPPALATPRYAATARPRSRDYLS